MNRFRLLPAAALVAMAFVVGAWLVQRAVDRRERANREGERLLDVVMQRVRDSYVEPVDEDSLWQAAMVGMMNQLGDPHSAYLSPERLELLNRQTSNSYRGVGLQVDARDGWITVTQPRPGSPAERAGLQAGDRLVEIDGRSMIGWTVNEAREAIRGPLGTSVRLVAERQGKRIPITLQRQDIRVSAVARATVLGGGVGYLAITTFSDSTEAEVTRAVDSLRRAGAVSMILDLRGNPGGLLDQGVGVADLFLPSGKQIATTKGRVASANESYVDRHAELWAAMPLAVLVNGLTASAAELVAGALQDHDRAIVLGRVTYGKGSAQALLPLENGAAIILTQSRWFTPLGRSLEMPLPDEQRLADADTARPVFRTASGRAVYGGGGIVPDILIGDSAQSPAERQFFAELGAEVPRWREALGSVARDLMREGAVTDSLFAVKPEWRARVGATLKRMRVSVSSAAFDEVPTLVDRQLGNEIARQAFGVPYAQRRQVRNDVVVQRAADVLRKAQQPQDVFSVE